MELTHQKYMQRAVFLAQKGTRLAYPNPSVGAVLVCNDVIIGEGYTDAYGGPHAEVKAINAVKDASLLQKATLYVTLEPCAHYGKTPPCSMLIVSKKIPKVYIGCVDTFSKVSGKGIEILKNAGCEVHLGLLEKDCLEMHKRFLTYHNEKRPYVILKWAETQDGFIDRDRQDVTESNAKPTWISNALSQQKVHQIRSEEQAILVGTQTALNDNPSLTTRSYGGVSPVRVLVDRTLKVPQSYQLYNGAVKTIVLTEKQQVHPNVKSICIDFSQNSISQILEALYKENIQSVLVEGGKKILDSFIASEFWDEAFVFVGASSFDRGVKAPVIKNSSYKVTSVGSDWLKHYKRS